MKSSRISAQTLGKWSVMLYALYFEFNQFLSAAFGYSAILFTLGIACVLMILSQFIAHKKLSKEAIWWLAFLIMVTVNNQSIANGKFTEYSNYAVIVLIGVFLISAKREICETIEECLVKMGLIHVFATLLFFMLPALYSFVANFFMG